MQLNPAVVLATADDGYLAYNVETNQLHRLNATAALVVELCDGARTEAEVLAQIAPLLESNAAAGCAVWMAQAVKDGLLISPPHATAASPSTAELQRLATRLRRRDRVLAAYVCQRRATELAPDDPAAWYAFGELAHIIGRRDEARTAYERYQQAHPEDVEIEHLLVALRDEPPPVRASDHYIQQLYSYFADFYDDNMRGDLDYRAPELLSAALIAAIGDRSDLTVLELGCGTGLFGELIRPRARWLAGIDLSSEMIARAKERKTGNAGGQKCLYDRLEVAEITQWLASHLRQQPEIQNPKSKIQNPPASFDVIAVCDTLIYFGDLHQVIPAAARHLAPGGVLGFTVEQAEEFPFRLTDSGRFAHHRYHLREVAEDARLDVVSQTAEVLRYEYGRAVTGIVTVLRNVEASL